MQDFLTRHRNRLLLVLAVGGGTAAALWMPAGWQALFWVVVVAVFLGLVAVGARHRGDRE